MQIILVAYFHMFLYFFLVCKSKPVKNIMNIHMITICEWSYVSIYKMQNHKKDDIMETL